MGTETHCLYGDGRSEVVADAENVVIWSDEKQSMVVLSRAAFREVVVGWNRLLAMEEEE